MRILFTAIFIIIAQQSLSDFVFRGEKREDTTFRECAKAIEKGVVIGVFRGGPTGEFRTFFYKDRLYNISAGGVWFECWAVENLKKR